MKHKDIERLIQKSLDRETNAEEEKKLHVHLSDCEQCNLFYEEMVQTEEVLGSLIELYPRHGFNDRVLKKLGFRRVFAWSKAAIGLAGAWLASMLFLAFSPLPGKALNQILTSAPGLIRFFDKIQVIVTSFGHLLIPFAKNAFSLEQPAFGLVFSIIITYLLSKIIKPVRNPQGEIELPAKGQGFLTG